MRKFTLFLAGILFSVLSFAQTLNLDAPVTLSNGAFGETIEDVGNGYNIITRDASRIFATPATTAGGSYSLGATTSFFANSADYSIYYRTTGGSPDFYKTGTAGSAPNRNITLEGATAAGATTFSITPNTPQDDYGVRTIGTTDGILTAALRKTSNSDLYQIVLLKTNPTGTIEWETSIPTDQTGYDDTFLGQDANGDFITEITPEPFVQQIQEVADGYVIVNMSRTYFPPGTNNLFANYIKLDFSGNILWSYMQTVPTRTITIGDAPSSEGNPRYFVGEVAGFEDGNTYIPFAGGGDLRPYAQVLILDNMGNLVTNYSTTYIVLDDASFQVKKFNNRIYWLRRTEVFSENGPPTFENDFSIADITDGFNLVDTPVALLPPTPDEFYVPNDMQLMPEGNFLVTGSKYPSSNLNGNNPDPADAEPFAVILEANIATSNGADLALSVSADDEGTGIYEDVTITYTVTNESNTTATGIVAEISRTSASVLAGGSPAVASQGALSLGYTENAVWEVGSLAGGQTATLTLTYFTLAANTSFFGQISAMTETDTDSTPDNGTFGDAQEDDEAGIEIGQQSTVIRGTVFLDENRDGGENCSTNDCTFISGIEINLYVQGTNILVATAVSQANGQYIFSNVAAGTYTLEYEYQNNYVPTPYFNGPFGFELRNNFLDINGETPYIGVITNSVNPERVLNLGLVDGTNCTLEELYVETICDDNDTPNNPNDDTFEVNFRADGQGRGAFSLNGGNGSLWNNSITYSDGFELIGPFDTDELPVTLTLDNLGNLPNVSCSLSETIASVDCGSTGGGLPDLTITTTGNIPASVQPGENYPSAANITNSGSATANGQFNNFIYLSTDANLDASDPSLSIVGLNILEAGQSTAFLNIFIPANTPLGEYFILYVVDDSNTVEESNENNNILARPVTVGPVGTGGVDLELTASSEVPNIYQNGEAVFTITNTGSETATNVEVLFAKNASLNITGVPTTTQGTSAVHWTAAPEWSVGTLAAGQSAMITFDVFSLSDAPTLYGQVVFQSEADADSTPDNGNGSTAVEDDEAVYPGGGSTGGEGLQVNCNTTTSPPSPIFVNPDININEAEVHWDIPTATTDCPGGIVNIEQINGPTQQGFFSPVSNGYDVVYEITDECGNSEICIISFNVNGFAGELICPDDITVTATSAAGAIVTFDDAVPFTGCDANPTGPFDGEPMSGDLFPIGVTEIRFAEFFSGSPSFCQNLENCYMNVTVLPEGGGGDDGVDLELTASSDAPTIYQNGTATFTITNNGNETATGVELEFHKNSTLNITGTPTVSQGTSQVHWTDVPRWNVGTLAAGQSATITYAVFSLSNNINFYGQVTAQNEADADSTPNNGNGTTPSEDDEVSYPGGGNTGGGNQADLTLANLNAQGPAAPGDIADYTVSVSNIGTATAAGSYLIGAYLSTDNQLSGNDIQVGVINTGNTPVGTEPLTTGAITVPANQTPGNYFLILETDTNGDIAESNENNNIVSTPFFVSVVDLGCQLNVSIGTVSCSTGGTPNDVSDDTYSFVFTVTGQNVSNTALMTANTNIPAIVNLGESYTVSGISASEAHVTLVAMDPDNSSCQSSATVNPPGTCGQGTGGGGCGLSAELVSVACLQNTDEARYSFTIRVDVEEGSDTENWSLAFPNNTNYSGSSTFYPQGSAAIADGVLVLDVIDQDNSACNTQVTVYPPDDCEIIPGCLLGVNASNIACDGDNFSFRLYVNSANTSDFGSEWTGVFPLADGSGGTFEIVRPINGSVFTNDNYFNYSTADVEQYLGGEINYTIYRTANPDCVIEGTLFLTESGCDPNLAAAGDIDLSLDIQVPTNVVPYQNFNTEYIVSNDGDVTATDVEVEVRLYSDFAENVFVLQGGNEATASQGEFDGEFGSIWSVGSIPPGGSATLTLNMFSLNPGSNIIYGQVSRHNERDIDSNPNSFILDNFLLIEREDDEKLATVTVSSNLQGGGTNNFTQEVNGLSATLYPVPTRGDLTVDVFMENAVETQLFVRDTNGKELVTESLAAQKGQQTVRLSTDNWAKGVYFLQLISGEEMKTYRFVKQ